MRHHIPARLLNLRLRERLSLAFLFLALLGGMTGGVGLLFVGRINAAFTVLAGDTAPIVGLTTQLQEDLQRMQATLSELLASPYQQTVSQGEKNLGSFYDQSHANFVELDRIVRHAGFDVNPDRAAAQLDTFYSQAERIIAAHKANVKTQADARSRSSDFDQDFSQAYTFLTTFAVRAESMMSEWEDQAKTLLQRQGDPEELELLLGTAFYETYPVVRGAYKLMSGLVELRETAHGYLTKEDESGLARAEQGAKTNLKHLRTTNRLIVSRLKDPNEQAEFSVVAGMIEGLESLLSGEKGLFAIHKEALDAADRARSLKVGLANLVRAYEEEINQIDRVAHDLNQEAERKANASIVTARWSVAGSVAGSVIVALGFGAWFARHLVARHELVEMQERERARVQKQNERFDLALTSMSQGLCMYDRDNKLIVMNERYAQLYSLPSALQEPGTPLRAVLEHKLATKGARAGDPSQYLQHYEAMAACHKPVSFTYDLVDGRSVSMSHVPIAGGGWVCTHEDVTERKKTEAQVVHMAHHDALTGLPNRVQLREHMERVLPRMRQGSYMAVLYLDLDGFKGVNDTLGHPAGDELLRMVAHRLRDHTRETDLVARLGGDEFAIIQLDAEQPTNAAALADRLVEALRTPFEFQSHRVEIGTSIGIMLADAATTTVDELLRSADIALYRAKAGGRGTWRFFEPAMDAEIQQRRALEADLRRAIVEGQFEVYYQPLVEARTQALTGFEALLRWRHPERGMISPADFIPLAEETGLIKSIGAWVLTRACTDAAEWPEPIKIAVNLSPVQFVGGHLTQEIEQALAVSGLSPSRLELEITETVLLQDNDGTLKILHRLQSLGVCISMDDFGTGYSSLSYLRRFPFDKIKIDQSFVRDLAGEKGSIEIIRAVVGLGKALGMEVLAEGVETGEQFEILQIEGCDELQGYLFSKPRPLQDVPGIISSYTVGKNRPARGPTLVIHNTGEDQAVA